MELIDKSVVVAEIERRMKLRYDSYKTYNSVSDFIAWEELEYFKEDFLPTLEIKEVDFETAFAALIDHFDEKNNCGKWPETDLKDFAKHFFELGIKARKEN